MKLFIGFIAQKSGSKYRNYYGKLLALFFKKESFIDLKTRHFCRF